MNFSRVEEMSSGEDSISQKMGQARQHQVGMIQQRTAISCCNMPLELQRIDGPAGSLSPNSLEPGHEFVHRLHGDSGDVFIMSMTRQVKIRTSASSNLTYSDKQSSFCSSVRLVTLLSGGYM